MRLLLILKNVSFYIEENVSYIVNVQFNRKPITESFKSGINLILNLLLKSINLHPEVKPDVHFETVI